MKKIIMLAFVIFSTLFALIPGQVLALGQMSQPIEIDNAIRGQQIHQEIIAINNDETEITVNLSADGQIKDWVKFFKPNDLNNSTDTMKIAARGTLNMIAVFSVPSDLPNGTYTGAVSVTNIPEENNSKDESSASVRQKIDREVTITISDQENISLAVSVIPESYDIGLNKPLNVRIIYDNQSNISLSPQIDFQIKKAEEIVYHVIYPYPANETPVNSQAIKEITALQVSTTNLSAGKYVAELKFLHNSAVIAEKQFSFSIGSGGSVLGAQTIDFLKTHWTWIIGGVVIILLIITGLLTKKKISS